MNKIICFIFVCCTCQAVAVEIDYTMPPEDGGGRGYSYYVNHSHSRDSLVYYHYTDRDDCMPCKKLERGKNDWYAQIGSDIIYGTYACSAIKGGEPTNAYLGPTFNSFYKISQPVSKNKIENDDNGIYCYCRISKFNDTSFNNSSWLWLGGGMSIYETDDWTVLSSERKNNLITACRTHCAEDCYHAMKDYEFRTEIYKTVNIQDSGKNCIQGMVFYPPVNRDESENISEYRKPLVGMDIYADSDNNTQKKSRTNGDGMFKICDIEGSESFSTLIGPPVLVCDLVPENDTNISDYINSDSVITFKIDCSHAIKEEQEHGEIAESEKLEYQENSLGGMHAEGQEVPEDKIKPTEKEAVDPNLYKDDQSKTLQEAEQKYKDAKAKEHSTANKTLSAVTTAATSLGGMQLAEGIAEQKADEAAEKDMRAYISTMKCEYGKGQQVTLSNEDVTLPGGNELLDLYTEYKQTAERLKQTKAALGLRAGIESEVLYDKARTGLYQYANSGKTGGGETSLFRALTDESSDDAAAWATQKEIPAKKRKVGATVAGAGAAVGVVGNMIINSDTVFGDPDQDE